MHTALCISFETIIAVQVSFPVSDAPLHNLRRAAKRRQRAAYWPGTRAYQRCQLSCYLTFCLTHGLDYVDPSEDTLCLYVEYLAQRFTNPKSVTNYLSAIQLFHNLSGVAASNIHGFQYRTMLRALPLTMRHTPLQRLPIDPRLLAAICRVCDNLSAMGIVLKLAFLVAFFGFLRQSNLAPPSPRTFDPSRHTTRGDVTVQAPGLVIRLKWSKTMQAAGTPVAIPIPAIPGHPLDPVAAYQAMLRQAPTRHPREPLLILPNGRPLCVPQLQQALNAILSALGQPAHLYSLHSLQRGGSTTSARAGADYIHVKRHGTWASDSFWDYIASYAIVESPVAQALARAVQTPNWIIFQSCPDLSLLCAF